tara:strand:- start:81 stop:647 length:567 start_codon:yes stop_codon:yes gene_type:complete
VKVTISILAAVVLSGCYSNEKLCAEAADYPATATIGTGYSEFELFDEGQLLDPSYGLQGGQHIWGAVQVTGLLPGDGEMVNNSTNDGGGGTTSAEGHDPLSVEFDVSFPDDILPSYSILFTDFFTGDVEISESAGHTVFIDLWEIAHAYPEEESLPIEMAVTVEDACGTVVSDSRIFTLDVTDPYYYY